MRFKKKYLTLILIFILVLTLYFIQNKEKEIYKFTGDTIFYSENRGKAGYEIISREKNGSLNIYKIKFRSRDFLEEKTLIYGFVIVPDKKGVPGLVFLPGGGGTKEGRLGIASSIARLGYAILVIDQRGVGETGGAYLNFEQDYQIFSQGKEPMQHLAVYDALRSYDVLMAFKEAEIDKGSIGLIGESMGARYAIIATAIDKRLKGVVAISTSGFHIPINPLQPGNDYLVSIDPDNYISSISPNFVMMLHGTEDKVVSLQDAQITFNKAKEPKKFYIAEGCGHGYCDNMLEEIKEGLEEIFEK